MERVTDIIKDYFQHCIAEFWSTVCLHKHNIDQHVGFSLPVINMAKNELKV